MPLKVHENVLVFYDSIGTYNPQNVQMGRKTPTSRHSSNYGKFQTGFVGKENLKDFCKMSSNYNDTPCGHYYGLTGYPTDILRFNNDKSSHPTAKPVALFEYLIRTYTDEGETVLDNCMGSGTTAVACIRSKRHFIGFETDEGYFRNANERIANTQVTFSNNLERWL